MVLLGECSLCVGLVPCCSAACSHGVWLSGLQLGCQQSGVASALLVPHPRFTTMPHVVLSQGCLTEKWLKKGSKRQAWFPKAPERNL